MSGVRVYADALPSPARRHQSFKSLRTNLARQAKKLEEMKGVAVPTAKLKSKQRKESRLENSMKNDSAREFATLKLKQGLAVRRWPRCHVAPACPTLRCAPLRSATRVVTAALCCNRVMSHRSDASVKVLPTPC